MRVSAALCRRAAPGKSGRPSKPVAPQSSQPFLADGKPGSVPVSPNSGRSDRTHLGGAPLAMKPLAMKKNVPPCPVEIRLLRAVAVMPYPQRIAHAVEQLWWLGR